MNGLSLVMVRTVWLGCAVALALGSGGLARAQEEPTGPARRESLKLLPKAAPRAAAAASTAKAVVPRKKAGDKAPPVPGETDAAARPTDTAVTPQAAQRGAATSATPTPRDEPPIRTQREEDDVPDTPEEIFTFKSNFEKDVKCRPLPLNARINIDFEEAPLYDVVKFMACLTQRNYIVATNLKQNKTITILSTTPVTVYEAYKAFLSALDVNGLTIAPDGEFYKILETAKAKTEPLPIYGANQRVPDEDRLITRIVTLKNIDVKDIEPVIGKFKTASGDVVSYAPGNSLIITDMGRNIVRILKFVEQLDIPTGREKIWVRPVQYASASDMATMITGLFGDKGQKGGGAAAKPAPAPRGRAQPATAAAGAAPADGSGGFDAEGPSTMSKIIADERTNQLIIVATPTAYLKIDRLLRRVDVPIEGEGQIHIYYLENATAEDVASTLSSLTSGAKKPAKGAKGGTGGSAALFEGDVKITAHKPTNSLVIESTLKDYMSVRRVIQQLDVRRKQVYVEAVIMEISSNKSRNLGISGSGGVTFNIGGNEVPFLFGMGGLGMSSLDLSQLQQGGLAIGLQGPLVDVSTGSTGTAATAGSLSIPSYGFAIQAIQSNSDVNVLSTPSVLTMDNEEAEIVVGKQIPYQATSYGGGLSGLSSILGTGGISGSTANTALSALGGLGGLGGYGSGYVQRIDVDLTLKITPQISESNFVKLKINQSIDDVESMSTTLGPTTSKRKVTNTVVVRDQQPVVIGGLIRDIESSGVTKVPVLGDIPILGILFRQSVKTIEKRNLLMVITPYIIEDPSDLRRIHDQKIEEMQQFAEYMATRKKEMQGGIDYRKKTGALEDMRTTIERTRKDREMLEQTRFSDVDQVGAAQTHDLEFDPFESVPAPTVAPSTAPRAAPLEENRPANGPRESLLPPVPAIEVSPVEDSRPLLGD